MISYARLAVSSILEIGPSGNFLHRTWNCVINEIHLSLPQSPGILLLMKEVSIKWQALLSLTGGPQVDN